MSRLIPRTLLALALLLSFCKTAMDGHVHSQSGQRHGGLAALVSGSQESASTHRCTGGVAHLHPSLERESTECFLCTSLRKSGIPVLEPISVLEPSSVSASVFDAPASLPRTSSLSSSGPRAPPQG